MLGYWKVLVTGILFVFDIIIETVVVVVGLIWLRLVMEMLLDFVLVFGFYLEIYELSILIINIAIYYSNE